MKIKNAVMMICGMLIGLLTGCAIDKEHYPAADNGELTIRTIPAARMLKTSMPGNYFESDGELFGRLFNYLQSNNLSMTVPVVSTIGENECSMAFYVAEAEKSQAAASQGKVEVVEMPEQTIAIMAFRGNNSPENYQSGVEKLMNALKALPGYHVNGDVFVTYWDAPMWPGFMRHYEICVPVKKQP